MSDETDPLVFEGEDDGRWYCEAHVTDDEMKRLCAADVVWCHWIDAKPEDFHDAKIHQAWLRPEDPDDDWTVWYLCKPDAKNAAPWTILDCDLDFDTLEARPPRRPASV